MPEYRYFSIHVSTGTGDSRFVNIVRTTAGTEQDEQMIGASGDWRRSTILSDQRLRGSITYEVAEVSAMTARKLLRPWADSHALARPVAELVP